MRRLLTALLVLAVFAVAADRLAWFTAERAIAADIQRSESLASAPDVHIGGFPFFTQALAGTYERVDAEITDLPLPEGPTLDRVAVTLRGAHLPLGELASPGDDRLPVDAVDVTASIDYASLNAAVAKNLGTQAVGVTVGAAGEGRLSLRGTLATPLLSSALAAEATVELSPSGTVVVRIVPDSLTGIPQALRSTVAALLDLTIAVPDLPFGLTATGVSVTDQGIVVTASGKDVVLETTR